MVKADVWQAAKPLAGRVLVGCAVGPGFEFEDFELIDPEGDIAQRIQDTKPDLIDML